MLQLRHLLFPTILAGVLLVSLAPGAAQDDDPQAQQRKKLAGYIDRFDESTSLRWNALQLQQYSRLQGDEVVPTLLNVYDRPPKDFAIHTPYLVGSYLRQRYAKRAPSENDLKWLLDFIKANDRRPDRAWAIYCFSAIIAKAKDEELNMELYEILGDDKAPATVRAAILEGLSESGCDFMRRILEILLLEEYADTGYDAVIFEAVCWAAARTYKPLYKQGEPLEGEWRALFDTISHRLDDREKLAGRSLREAALALQYCFGTRHPYQWGMMWRQLFKDGKDPFDSDGNTVAKFMGLDVRGDRVLFLIDASDSMLNPLSDAEKEAVKRPITGDKKEDDDLYEIDWERVHNRFDVAREHVKWTVSRLPEDKRAAVMLFGDTVEMLPATPSFIELKSSNKRRIRNSLDGIRPGKATGEMAERRPYGVLLGETNYYQALISSYRLDRHGIVKGPREHYDLGLVSNGADAILLLSDGAPIIDGFSGDSPVLEYESVSWSEHSSKQSGEGRWVEYPAVPAQPEREVVTRDPETGAEIVRKVPPTPARPARKVWLKKEIVKYKTSHHDDHGPYVSTGMAGGFELGNFLEELRRLNLVRRCRIHCVGIGEADMTWLKPIARVGGGQAQYFGPENRTPKGLPDLPLPGGLPRKD